jgi:GlcNAc-P-P-Und epimerase
MQQEYLGLSHTLDDNPTLILGGSGFIGSRLAARLVEKGMPIRIGDQKRSEIFPDLWDFCDVRNIETLRAPFSGASAIVNLAAEHRDDVRPISRYYETNVKGASEACQAARDAGIKKIIFTSSVAVYGFHPHPVSEEGPFRPFNPYGETKLQAEDVYQTWAREDPSRTLVIIRPTVVFGEQNRGNVYNLLRQIATGKFMMVGAGKNAKSMAYVGNVVDFIIHTLSLERGIHIFNYVDGPDLDMNTLVDHVRRCMGKSNQEFLRIPKHMALAGGHLLDGVARIVGRPLPISAIRVRKFCESTQFKADRISECGFKAKYSLREALTRTIESEFLTQ